MRHSFTLEYWLDEGWYVGRLKEVPGVFSQGESLEDLEEKMVLLSGPRQCGKTTLAKVILGLYRPNDGKVFVDGADLAQFAQPVQRREPPPAGGEASARWTDRGGRRRDGGGPIAPRPPGPRSCGPSGPRTRGSGGDRT
mgnify:CR=1 FL=1